MYLNSASKERQQRLIALFFFDPANCSISFFCCKLFVRNIRANIFIAGEEFPAKKREPIGKQQQQIQQKLPSINEQRLRPCWIPGIIKQSNTRIHKGSPTPPLRSSLLLPFSYLLQPLSRLPLPNWEPTGRCSELVKSGLGIGIGFGPGLAFKQRGRGRGRAGEGRSGCRACSFLPATHLLNTIGLRLQHQLQPGHNTFGYNFTWLELRLRLGLGLGTADWGMRTGDWRLHLGVYLLGPETGIGATHACSKRTRKR